MAARAAAPGVTLESHTPAAICATAPAATAQAIPVPAPTPASVSTTETWFFPNSPVDCPGALSSTTVVAQRFERGLMIGLEAADWRPFDEIVILYDDENPTAP
jgi:hypothetical protein